MLKFNKKMIENLEKIKKISNDGLQKNIKIIWPEFLEIGGCIIIDKNDDIKEEDIDKMVSLNYDRTGFEASYNEFRIEDNFDGFVQNTIDGLSLAMKLSEIWECKLKRDYSDYKFHIVVSYDENSTSMRFYKLRDEESSWISINNLDEYEDESLAVIIV